MFWLLVFPVLLAAGLYLLKFFVLGRAVMGASGRVRSGPGRALVWLAGLGIMLTPFLYVKYRDAVAVREAQARQERLAGLERVELAGRMPQRILFVGRGNYGLAKDVAARFGLREFPADEAERLETAYRNYRKAEYCRRTNGDATMEGTAIPLCRAVEGTVGQALGLRERVLVFADGASVSHRQSNTFVGEMYELRLVGPGVDALVDYYEQTMIAKAPGLLNPYGSGWRLDPDEEKVRAEVFLEQALEGGRRRFGG